VLLGFCSGVDSAYAVALEDPRVVGAIFIEGYAYKNLGFWLRYCTVRNLQPARWRRYVRLRLHRLRKNGGGRREVAEIPEIFTGDVPPRRKFGADLARLVERSVRMLFVYTVVSDNHYNYRSQFHDTFGYRKQIDVRYYTRADHTFSTEAHRAKLLANLVSWMHHRFPEQASAREAIGA
jgi:hypothetical protein